MPVFDAKSVERRIKKIVGDYTKTEKKIVSAALNAAAKTGTVQAAKDIRNDTGYKAITIKRAMRIRRAKPSNLSVAVIVKGSRQQFAGAREIKRKGKSIGVSYLAHGKRRVKNMDIVKAGASKLFMIQGSNSAKQVVVYREAGFKKKVKSFIGPSMPHLFKKKYDDKLRKTFMIRIPIEIDRQSRRYRR